jgi:hypothetical protein
MASASCSPDRQRNGQSYAIAPPRDRLPPSPAGKSADWSEPAADCSWLLRRGHPVCQRPGAKAARPAEIPDARSRARAAPGPLRRACRGCNCRREFSRPYRRALGLTTRRPKEQPEDFPVTLKPKSGEPIEARLRASDHPILTLLLFPPPAVLQGEQTNDAPVAGKVVIRRVAPLPTRIIVDGTKYEVVHTRRTASARRLPTRSFAHCRGGGGGRRKCRKSASRPAPGLLRVRLDRTLDRWSAHGQACGAPLVEISGRQPGCRSGVDLIAWLNPAPCWPLPVEIRDARRIQSACAAIAIYAFLPRFSCCLTSKPSAHARPSRPICYTPRIWQQRKQPSTNSEIC